MGEHKGAITLIIVTLIIFGAFVAFATGVFDPLMTSIGNKFSSMVNSVLDNAGTPSD